MTRELVKTQRTSENFVNGVGSGYKKEDVDIINLHGKELGVYVTDMEDSMHDGLTVFRFKIIMNIKNKEDREYWNRVINKTDGNLKGYDIDKVFDEVDKEMNIDTSNSNSTNDTGRKPQSKKEESFVDIIVDIFR